MAVASIAKLEDRGVVLVSGTDAYKLLAGLITSEMADLGSNGALFAGLLSPQGKILFDFIVSNFDGGYRLDVARDKATELVKRLTLYRLRAAVEIKDVSEAWSVLAAWGDNVSGDGLADPRRPELGKRIIVPADDASKVIAVSGANHVQPELYHQHRIDIGVPEGGKDYDFGDAYPHEALFDQVNGVSFTKGCYVGQEIVSRMEHRGTARKRVVRVTGERELSSERPQVFTGDQPIGKLGSVHDQDGLALLRLDRAAEASRKGLAITADGVAVKVDIPPWAKFSMPSTEQAEN